MFNMKYNHLYKITIHEPVYWVGLKSVSNGLILDLGNVENSSLIINQS